MCRNQTAKSSSLLSNSNFCLRGVNQQSLRGSLFLELDLPVLQIREEQVDEGVAKDSGNFTNDLIECGIAIAHE
jgi:hypothetical protein